MSGLATLRTRDGLSYKMPAGNITKAALDSAFHIDARAIECHGVAITPSTNGVFYGALPDHTYTVYARDTGERRVVEADAAAAGKEPERRHALCERLKAGGCEQPAAAHVELLQRGAVRREAREAGVVEHARAHRQRADVRRAVVAEDDGHRLVGHGRALAQQQLAQVAA